MITKGYALLYFRGYPPDHSPGKPSIYQHVEGGSPVLIREGDEATVRIEYRNNTSASPGENGTENTARAELGSDTETELSTHRGVRVNVYHIFNLWFIRFVEYVGIRQALAQCVL